MTRSTVSGADRFVFNTNHGADIIYDFEDGIDKIQFPDGS